MVLVFVPAERQIESAFGTLIVFDRTASQNALKPKPKNINLLIMLAAIGAQLNRPLVHAQNPPTQTRINKNALSQSLKAMLQKQGT